MTKSAALEFLDWGIRANSVHPAQVDDTVMTDEASPPGYREAARRAPHRGGRISSYWWHHGDGHLSSYETICEHMPDEFSRSGATHTADPALLGAGVSS